MKTVIYCCVFTLVSLWSLSAFGQGTCHDNGGGYPTNGGQAGYPYGQADPYGTGAGGFENLGSAGYPSAAPQAGLTAPVSPSARISVVSANATSSRRTASTTRSAKLTVVADDSPSAPKAIEIASVEPVVIDEKIAGLIGTWKAVARRGDGELTTVELHLDNRGWAELTVPGSDGKPSTTKSRVNLENEELKLTDADKVVSLGKLVDFNTRQMVLERAEGQLTFVRL
jgi:hypothetical protein